MTEYFEYAGVENTENTLKYAVERAKLGIFDIVVASSYGETAKMLLDSLEKENLNVNVVVVTYHRGFSGPDIVAMPENIKKDLEKRGAKVFSGTHALSGVERGISKRLGGYGPVEVIAQTLKTLGQGVKVCYEVTVMAADAGLVSTKKEIIAIGGSSRGADSAVVILPSNMNTFFDIELRELICMPRNKKKHE
ncbi:pyruvate kinase alpha/beta domain-containing protein [Methanococcus maripaludis]|uniref:Pyruvate kinase C-terminal domain-containing protein n=2 Tax=Methanococcus maripaludis TaxID=39152 RepID=A0A7J9PF71_METMI|nr:pyruvate kinase alpha/beta domain-containing protein [Methanococcus maripaludis]MBA2861923.1 hypothetical protein [Methanococcus maripaludis]